jgi:hypothetical protein
MNRLSPAEQETVVKLLLVPGATCRSVAKLTGYAKSTVFLLAGNLKLPPCPCGEKAGHRGWCKYRYELSPSRKQVMKNMRPLLEWCGVCLQDDLKVMSIEVVSQVPLCQACKMNYGDEPAILEEARRYLKSIPQDKKPAPFVEPGVEPDIKPLAATVIHKCACGCGTTISEKAKFAVGHSAKAVWQPSVTPAPQLPTPVIRVCACGCGFNLIVGEEKFIQGHPEHMKDDVELCGCGKPLKHAGRCKGMEVIREHNINTRVAVPAEMVPVTRTKSTTIKRTRTQTDEVQIQQNHEVTMNRRVTILVPKAKEKTQVMLTPEIVDAVWKSLTMEQKFNIFGVEEMWGDFDDWLRMGIINKILLVEPDDVYQAKKEQVK